MTDPFIPFFKPDISEAAISAVAETLRSGWLTSGPKTREFETRFAVAVGADHAVAVNSCTAGLHLSLAALGVTIGDEVIVPTMTFAATAEVVVHLGATPVLVDCAPDTFNVDPAAVSAAITPRTKAIVPVHFGGQPAEMDEIVGVAAKHGIPTAEDAAHAFPATYRGRTVGTIGDVTAFSFYANKTITTGEGGMITTADEELAERIRMLSLHGLSNDPWNRFSERGSWDYDIAAAGYKYNLTDIAAAIGISQLNRSEEFLAARRHQAERYDEHFLDFDGIRPLQTLEGNDHAHHLYVVLLDVDRLAVDRNEIIAMMKSEGIGTSVHYRPLHLHTLYRDRFGYRPEDFPVATDVFPRIISMPIYPLLTDDALDRAAGTLKHIVDSNRRP